MDVVYDTISTQKTSLLRCLEVVESSRRTVHDDSWKQFTDVQKGNGSTVLHYDLVTIFEEPGYHIPTLRLWSSLLKQNRLISKF